MAKQETARVTTGMKKSTGNGKKGAPRINICLAFSDQAEEAMKFYVATFPNSRILNVVRGWSGGPVPMDKILQATFELNGQPFAAMDAGPSFSFAQGMSIVATCDTQDEIDSLWKKLSEGGEEQPCGWVKDRFGVSWQIVPASLGDMMSNPKDGNTKRVMEALLKMGKLDARALEKAYRER